VFMAGSFLKVSPFDPFGYAQGKLLFAQGRLFAGTRIAAAPSFLACLCDSRRSHLRLRECRRKTRQQAKARRGPGNNI